MHFVFFVKVVNCYGLSVLNLSMSVMGFHKNVWIAGWGELHPFFIFICFNFAKPLSHGAQLNMFIHTDTANALMLTSYFR